MAGDYTSNYASIQMMKHGDSKAKGNEFSRNENMPDKNSKNIPVTLKRAGIKVKKRSLPDPVSQPIDTYF